MNEEIDLLKTEVSPLLAELAQQYSIEFSAKSSDVLSQFYEKDETAKFIFESFVTSSSVCQSCGGLTLTITDELEKIYADPPLRGKELTDNRIFVFAIDGDGSFFGFGLDSRKFYHFDFSPWIGEEDPWNECLSAEWDIEGFCEFFAIEYAAN